MVRRRISDISCYKEYFDKAAPAYDDAFKISSFNEKPTSVEYSYDSLTCTSREIINTASYSVEKISRAATLVCQIWQVSFKTITPLY